MMNIAEMFCGRVSLSPPPVTVCVWFADWFPVIKLDGVFDVEALGITPVADPVGALLIVCAFPLPSVTVCVWFALSVPVVNDDAGLAVACSCTDPMLSPVAPPEAEATRDVASGSSY